MRRRPCLHSTCRRGLKLLGTDSSPCFSKSEHLVLARPAPARRRRRGPRRPTPKSRARWLLLQLCGLLQFQLDVSFPRRSGDPTSPPGRPRRATLRALVAVPVARAARRFLFCSGSSPCRAVVFLSILCPARAALARRAGAAAAQCVARALLAFLGCAGPSALFIRVRTSRDKSCRLLKA